MERPKKHDNLQAQLAGFQRVAECPDNDIFNRQVQSLIANKYGRDRHAVDALEAFGNTGQTSIYLVQLILVLGLQ